MSKLFKIFKNVKPKSEHEQVVDNLLVSGLNATQPK